MCPCNMLNGIVCHLSVHTNYMDLPWLFPFAAVISRSVTATVMMPLPKWLLEVHRQQELCICAWMCLTSVKYINSAGQHATHVSGKACLWRLSERSLMMWLPFSGFSGTGLASRWYTTATPKVSWSWFWSWSLSVNNHRNVTYTHASILVWVQELKHVVLLGMLSWFCTDWCYSQHQ